MFFKIIHDRLPAHLLHFHRVGILRVESFNYGGRVSIGFKSDGYFPAIGHGIFN